MFGPDDFPYEANKVEKKQSQLNEISTAAHLPVTTLSCRNERSLELSLLVSRQGVVSAVWAAEIEPVCTDRRVPVFY